MDYSRACHIAEDIGWTDSLWGGKEGTIGASMSITAGACRDDCCDCERSLCDSAETAVGLLPGAFLG